MIHVRMIHVRKNIILRKLKGNEKSWVLLRKHDF